MLMALIVKKSVRYASKRYSKKYLKAASELVTEIGNNNNNEKIIICNSNSDTCEKNLFKSRQDHQIIKMFYIEKSEVRH